VFFKQEHYNKIDLDLEN